MSYGNIFFNQAEKLRQNFEIALFSYIKISQALNV